MMVNPNILLITGDRGTGKTTLCSHLIQSAQSLNWETRGVLSLSRFTNGAKARIEAQDIHSGKHQLLAWRRSPGQKIGNSLSIGHWMFNEKTFEWGNKLLKEATHCDLLVVDELGPLEFQIRQGWCEGVNAILAGRYRLLIVVVRFEFIQRALQRWPQAYVVLLNEDSLVDMCDLLSTKFLTPL